MILASCSIQEYFREMLMKALKDSSVELTDHAEVYLVGLLTEFMRTENAFAGVDPGEKPALTVLFGRAQESDKEEATRIYKHLGDSSLYLISFFNDSKQSELVGENYYITMGESAYQSVSVLMRDSSGTAAALYAELADRFSELVGVLKAVNFAANHANSKAYLSDEKLIELVEKYKKTRNSSLLEILRAHGVTLDEAPAESFETSAKVDQFVQ